MYDRNSIIARKTIVGAFPNRGFYATSGNRDKTHGHEKARSVAGLRLGVLRAMEDRGRRVQPRRRRHRPL